MHLMDVRVIMVLVGLGIVASGCASWHSTTKFVPFPPGSTAIAFEPSGDGDGRVKPRDGTFAYKLAVNVRTRDHLLLKNNKVVSITVVDRERARLLEDQLEFHSADIDVNVEWTEFSKITIHLAETGRELPEEHPFAKDEYLQELTRNGPRALATLEYLWDSRAKRFSLSE